MKQHIQRKYIAYTRSAVENNQSIAKQKQLISEYAQSNGLKITNWFEDNGTPGGERPGLSEAIHLFEREPEGACGFIAYRPDRIARNLLDLSHLLEVWEERNVEIRFVEQIDTRDKEQSLLSKVVQTCSSFLNNLKKTESMRDDLKCAFYARKSTDVEGGYTSQKV